jgi:hypothetical protein
MMLPGQRIAFYTKDALHSPSVIGLGVHPGLKRTIVRKHKLKLALQTIINGRFALASADDTPRPCPVKLLLRQ